ncbi:MAG: porin [Planctomycetota bacterium]
MPLHPAQSSISTKNAADDDGGGIDTDCETYTMNRDHKAKRVQIALRRPRTNWGWAPLLLTILGGLGLCPTATQADDLFVVLAESGDGQSIELPSPSASLDSFQDVSDALTAERRRMADLEARLKKLEGQGAKGEVEPLPPTTPASKDATAKDAAGDAGGKKDAPKDGADAKKTDAKKEEKKPDEPYEVGTDTALKTRWEPTGVGSFTAESEHKDFRVKIGGRTQFDSVAFSAASGPREPPDKGGLAPGLSDTVNFRRARIRIEGRMYELYDWAAEYDFVNQLNVANQVFPTESGQGPFTAVTDLWFQVRELPILGTMRVGNQKDPYGFEHLTSSRFLNFMERSYSQDAFEGPFNNGFLPGIQFLNNNEDGSIGWQVGEFKNNANVFGYSNYSGGSSTVGRLIYLPIYEDQGRQLLHVGISGKTQGLRNGQVRFRSRGDIRNGPPGGLNSIYADSGLLTGTWQNLMGLELVGNNGPWSFQSEYFGSWLYNASTTNLGPLVTNGIQPAPGTNVGTVFYQSGYAEVLYFLTGESRTYTKLEYRFDRPIPRNNFYVVRGGGRNGPINFSEGAWQVGARYNYLCLNDRQVNGGVLNGMTLGLNWLINPNARVYFNYDLTYRQFISTPYTNVTTSTADLTTGVVKTTTSVVPSPSYNGSGFINGLGMRLAFDF